MRFSAVVKLEEITPYVVEITMEDRHNKNTFSYELVEGLIEAFRKIESSDAYRVAILTGYENYFCSGGTKEGLLAIYEGKSKFSDSNVYSLPLDCKIPVISAMQGHGIGGGFVFGMYADFAILSIESIYTTNFMKYGFTPGFGATYILKEKMGFPLAHEMLVRANNLRGVDLKDRGINFPVVSRAEVLPLAIEMAKEISEKPRNSLITLKEHMVRDYRNNLPKYVQMEEVMHDKTFHTEEVKERIESVFGK